MIRILSCVLPVAVTTAPVLAQESVRFGAWRAFCAPMAGCVLGVKSEEGDTLAFVEPPTGDDRLLLFLETPVRAGARVSVTMDGVPVVTLGPADGWRRVDSPVGRAIQIAPSVVREGLDEPMRKRNRMEIAYSDENGGERRVLFSLNGYADTRSYADDG